MTPLNCGYLEYSLAKTKLPKNSINHLVTIKENSLEYYIENLASSIAEGNYAITIQVIFKSNYDSNYETLLQNYLVKVRCISNRFNLDLSIPYFQTSPQDITV